MDESVIDGSGDDIFIREVGGNGEQANVFVSNNGLDFTFLGVANDSTTTSFDLADIGFADPVGAIRIVGLDSAGASPGFDVVNVEVLTGSIGEPTPIVPTPAAAGGGLVLLAAFGWRRSRGRRLSS